MLANKKFISILVISLLISPTFAQTFESSGKIVGVDNQGKGVVGNITVEIQPGKGRVLVDTQPLTGVYTQDSERIAVKVVSEVAGFNFSEYDVIYTIRTPDANIVEGPSAGSMMALATLAALKGKTLSDGFSMTGIIQEDHTIGKIGAVLTKAKSAADSGVTVFLIPKDQTIQYEYVRKTKSPSPGWVVETIEPIEVDVIDLAKEWGMEIHEVATIEEAIQYAFNNISTGKLKKTVSSSPIIIPLFSSPVSIYKEFGSLSSEEVERAHLIYTEAKNKLEEAVIPDDVKGALDLLLTRAQLLSDEANAIQNRGYRYSSGNNAFKAIINSDTVNDLIDYYSLPREVRKIFLVNRANEAKNEIATLKPQIESQTKNSICDADKFEWAVAARQRITYAENKVASITLPEDGNISMTSPADILFDINIAEEWVEISKNFASKASSNVAPGCLDKFQTKANEILTKARTNVIAAETRGLKAASDGKWFLDAAEKEFSQGWYITAIYDATSAEVRSRIGSEYEKMNLTKIYTDFNTFDITTTGLIGTIFFEHAQYSMYTAVKDDDQYIAVEAITLINLAKDIDDDYSDVKSQLTSGKSEFRIDRDAFIALLVVLMLAVLFYVNKLRSDIGRLEKAVKASRKISRRRRKK